MNIEFSSSRLQGASTSIGESYRLFGPVIGRKYVQRILILRATEEFHQLFGHKALKLHSLKGNRDKQYALTLTGNYRLILEKIDDETVRVVEVEDYHGN